MDGLRAIIAAHLPPALRAAWWRSVAATRLSPVATYLRGLTPGRVGLVLVICAILTVRQQSVCVAQLDCGIPDSRKLAESAYFLARQFLFSLPMLFSVTIADNLTTRTGQRTRLLALSAAVLLGAIVYAFAFHSTQP